MDKIFFVLPNPLLHLFLFVDGGFNIFKELVIQQVCAIVFFCKNGAHSRPVFVDPCIKIRCHTSIKDGSVLVGYNVNITSFYHDISIK